MCWPQIIRRDMKTLRWTSDHLRRLLSSAPWGNRVGVGASWKGDQVPSLCGQSIGGTLPTESGWPNAEAAPWRVLSYLKEMSLSVSGSGKQLQSLMADSSFIVWCRRLALGSRLCLEEGISCRECSHLYTKLENWHMLPIVLKEKKWCPSYLTHRV